MVIDITQQIRAVGYTTSALIGETVDRRLMSGSIPNVTVHLNRKERVVARCAVRAIGSHEIVLIVGETEGDLAAGDRVTFSLCEGDAQLISEEICVIHWATTEDDTRIVALFSVRRLDLLLNHRLIDDRRTDIRYPVDLKAFVRVGRDQTWGRIVNYSLNGLCFASDAVLELNRSYHATVLCDGSSFDLSVDPHWIQRIADRNVIGCSLQPQHGVLFARRYLAKPIHPDQLIATVSQFVPVQAKPPPMASLI